MEIMLAEKIWQRALVYSIRTDVGVKELGIDPDTEFDSYDTFDTLYVLALDGHLPAGACRIRFTDENTAKIERVNVVREYRGNGTGRLLVQFAEKYSASCGHRNILITSREEAVGFYEKLGYTAHADEAFRSTVYRVIPMKKELLAEV